MYVDFIEPCFGIGHNLSLICQMTSEDIKHQLIIIKMCSSKVLLKLWEQMEFPWCQTWGIWWVISKFKAEAKNCFHGGDS